MDEDSIIIACMNCTTRNRIPMARINDNPVCAKCKSSLAGIPYFPVNITDNQFNKEVLQHKGAVMVDCWAPWCGPCRSVAPILDTLARNYAGQVKITKLNVDENQMTASQYAVRSIPTMLFFKNGKLKDTLVGALPRPEMEKKLQELI